ncbi:putative Ccc1 family protein [Helianthus annuus]|nr:putative Ccc1 family protein [Helianthus annuus]KAJ0586698.1 putative Ccc1 family protein [Helianthus annuus]KAJ0756070.1 putative Ccc1 family protein [Helianthus annuus]KAJ0759859.1 putative Ccc1 family protein [Helianthus annuus]KAJ0929552.1 putative Ccc1 family protein [Helianthus annuus]
MGSNNGSEKYLVNRHKENLFTASEIVRDVIIGVFDNLTVSFTFVAGLPGANVSSSIILTASIAEIATDAISMGLQGYLAAKTEVGHYDGELRRQQEEIDTIPDLEASEEAGIMVEYGVRPHEYGVRISFVLSLRFS